MPTYYSPCYNVLGMNVIAFGFDYPVLFFFRCFVLSQTDQNSIACAQIQMDSVSFPVMFFFGLQFGLDKIFLNLSLLFVGKTGFRIKWESALENAWI